jgi:hypothetical protein
MICAPSRLAMLAVVFMTAVATFAAFASVASAKASLQNERCLVCHGETDAGTISVDGEARNLSVDEEAYSASRHGLIDCTGCHIGFKPGDHSEEETDDWLYIARVQACGTCHADIYGEYELSIHGDSVARREGSGAPTCATCHGSHEIGATTTTVFRQESLNRCRVCHGGRSDTYLDTYHGKAFVLGRPDAPVCSDCHGAHFILPQANPQSTVSDENVVATCATCHPGANESFSTYIVHIDPRDPSDSLLVFLTYAFYILLMTVVFTFGGVHTVMYFYRGRKEGRYKRSHD